MAHAFGEVVLVPFPFTDLRVLRETIAQVIG